MDPAEGLQSTWVKAGRLEFTEGLQDKTTQMKWIKGKEL